MRPVEERPRRRAPWSPRGSPGSRARSEPAADASATPRGERGHAGERVRARQLGQVAAARSATERSARSGWRRQARQPAAEHLELAGDALGRCTARVGRRDLAPLGARVEQHAEDLVARHAVDDRVVDLGQQRHAAALQAVDQVELPQRAGAVQRPGEDPRDGLGQLAVVAGRRHRRVADVEVQVEVRVLDPVRVVEPERDLDQPPAERRQQVDALADEAADVGHLELAAGRGRRGRRPPAPPTCP